MKKSADQCVSQVSNSSEPLSCGSHSGCKEQGNIPIDTHTAEVAPPATWHFPSGVSSIRDVCLRDWKQKE